MSVLRTPWLKARFDSDREHFPTCAGSGGIEIEYAPKYAADGTLTLKEVGKHDLYADIQSHADSVDLNNILARYSNGDPSALNVRTGNYGDFVGMPKTYAELLNRTLDGERQFNQLPLEVREKFDYDFGKWLASAGTDDWCAAMGFALNESSAAETLEKEVNVNEP